MYRLLNSLNTHRHLAWDRYGHHLMKDLTSHNNLPLKDIMTLIF